MFKTDWDRIDSITEKLDGDDLDYFQEQRDEISRLQELVRSYRVVLRDVI